MSAGWWQTLLPAVSVLRASVQSHVIFSRSIRDVAEHLQTVSSSRCFAQHTVLHYVPQQWLWLCPIHLSLRCCTVSMFLFSWTLCSTSSFDTQLRSSPFLSKPRFQYLIVHLCLSSIKGNAPHCTLCYFFPSCIIHFPASSRGATPSNDYSCNYFSSDPICTATIGQRYRRTDGRTGNLR